MYAILSDIHSNYEALKNVVTDLNNFSLSGIFVLGDIIGYGPDPNACVEEMQKLGVKAIQGNHERALKNFDFLNSFNPLAAETITWTGKKLDRTHMEYLENLPEQHLENEMTFVHGSLLDPDKYILEYADILQEMEILRLKGKKIEFFGHTHMKIIYVEDEGPITPNQEWIKLNHNKIYLINPGSVGQPRDREPSASYVIFDPAGYRILFRQIPYDVNVTIAKMKKEGFPAFTYNRLKLGI